MLLTGTFLRSLDDKGRLAIPKRLRDGLNDPQLPAMYLAPGTDGSLALYEEIAFARLADQLGRVSPTGQEVRAFSRLFYAQAQRIDVDRQGRIRIPPELAALGSLDKEIVLVGVRDHLEIWDRKHWENYLSQKQSQYDELAESAFAGAKLEPTTAYQPKLESTSAYQPSLETETRPTQPR